MWIAIVLSRGAIIYMTFRASVVPATESSLRVVDNTHARMFTRRRRWAITVNVSHGYVHRRWSLSSLPDDGKGIHHPRLPDLEISQVESTCYLFQSVGWRAWSAPSASCCPVQTLKWIHSFNFTLLMAILKLNFRHLVRNLRIYDKIRNLPGYPSGRYATLT